MRRAAVAAALACAAAALPSPAHADPWATAWMGAQQDPGPIAAIIPFGAGTGGRTVRDVVRVEATGAVLRIRLTNLFGTRPLTFQDVRVALAANGAATTPGTSVRVTFGARRTVTLRAGATVTSDPVRRAVRFGQRLAISAYSAGPTGAATTSGSLLHTNYISAPGDAAASASGAAFTTTAHSWYYAAGVDVRRASATATGVVAFGASTTAGQGATADAYRSWPDLLADRLGRPVLNAGVSGNALHASSPCFGQSGPLRFGRDVLAQHGAGTVLIDLGANDLLQPRQPHTGLLGPCDVRTTATTPRLIQLYERLAARAHAHHIKAYALTITPFAGASGATPDALAQRARINAWLRAQHAFDGVFDLGAAIGDPADPTRLNHAYDAGDHLHLDDAGYAAIARAITLR